MGPNGAGKPATLRTRAGELSPIAGEVRFLGSATSSPMHDRCRRGLGYVSEERSVIMGMTILENLKLARVSPEVACEHFPALQRILKRKDRKSTRLNSSH